MLYTFLSILHFPMTTITAADIANITHHWIMSLDGTNPFLAHYGKFFCRDFGIHLDLLLYPQIKVAVWLVFFLSATLSAILSAILIFWNYLFVRKHLRPQFSQWQAEWFCIRYWVLHLLWTFAQRPRIRWWHRRWSRWNKGLHCRSVRAFWVLLFS